MYDLTGIKARTRRATDNGGLESQKRQQQSNLPFGEFRLETFQVHVPSLATELKRTAQKLIEIAGRMQYWTAEEFFEQKVFFSLGYLTFVRCRSGCWHSSRMDSTVLEKKTVR